MDPALTANPFPGLRSFEPDEDHLFFGRERETDELLRRLRRTRFLAVVGASGSGKSSLVRSGLVPALHGGQMVAAGSRWRVAILRPGEDPIGHLAAALDAVLPPDGALDGTRATVLESTFRGGSTGLVDGVRHARLGARDNVLVVVDQFEELFRFARVRGAAQAHDDAHAFVRLLLAAAAQREVPVYLLLTMRSDFIGDCMAFPGLPEAVNDGQYLVPRMSRDELRAAITGPVAVAGGAIEPRLVVRLLNEVGDNPFRLPVLQHALMRTWACWEAERAPSEPIGVRHYEAVGTMAEALSRHADEPYHELGERERAIAETLFRALTDVDAGGRGIRRPTRVREVAAAAGAGEEEVIRVVERFRAPGRSFVTASRVPLAGDTILDLSHEALIRSWVRLGEWVREEARSAAHLRRVAAAAREHRQGTGSLWRNPELGLATRWRAEHRPTAAWAARYDPDFTLASSFLDASERDVRRQRRLRMATAMSAVLALLLVVAAFGYARQKEIEADARTAAAWAREEKTRDSLMITALEDEIETLQRRNPVLEAFAVELQEKNQGLRGRQAVLLVEADSLRQLIPQLRPLVAELRRDVAVAEENNRRLARENEEMEARRAALAAEAEPLQQADRRLRREAETLHERERWLWSVATALGLLPPAPEVARTFLPPEPRNLSGIALRNGYDDSIEIVSLRVTLDSLRVQNLGLMERIAALQRDNERLQRDVATLQDDVDRLHETAVRLQSQQQQLTQRLDSLGWEWSHLRTVRSRLTEAVDSLDTTVQALRRSVALHERDNPERQARVRELEAMLGLDADGTVMARMVIEVAGAEEDAQRTAIVALTAYQLGLRQGLRDDPVLLGGLLLARDRLDGTPELERWWDAAEPESLILGPDGRPRVEGRRLRAEVCGRLPASLRPEGC